MTPVLVTGAAGYIGSVTCKLLSHRGYLPIGFDNLSRGHREAVRWGPLEVGDVRDRARVARVLAAHGPRAIVHFAALANVEESVHEPALYYDNNVVGSMALADAARAAGAPPVVFSSTCAVYGHPERSPIDESQRREPINPYGATKLAVERIFESYERAYGLRSVRLRYFNAAGADPELETGEHHDPETHLVPRVLDVAAGRTPYLEVYGTDFDTPDRTCVRDYIHVLDLAAAHVRALEYLLSGGAGVSVNLGTGRGFSVLEVVKAAEAVTGRTVAVVHRPRRAGDPPALVANARRAGEVLGWSARYTDLKEVLAHAWGWHQRAR
jgi:UDP-arabinose 4-epimerase